MFFKRKPKSNQDSLGPQLRKISQEELLGIIERHREWLIAEDTGNENHTGQKADLSSADLRGRMFEHADLRKALFLGSDLRGGHLDGCNLQGASMAEVDLRGAYLPDANMKEAYLFGACLDNATLCSVDFSGAVLNAAVFHGADLSDTTFTDVKGLKSDALAGAVVTGAKLPGDIKDFEGLKYISGAAGGAAKLFTTLLLACLYCWITLGGLIGRSAGDMKVKLPVADVDLPLEGFLFLAPAILIALYIYMHLYLQNIWEAFAGLPAVFQDGSELHKKASAWLPLGFARAFSPRLRPGRRLTGHINHLLTIFLLWMVAPLTVMFFLITGIHIGGNHGLPMVIVQGGLLVVATVAAMYFHFQASATLSLYTMKTREYAERFLADITQDFSYQTLRKELILFLALFLGLMALAFALDFIPRG